MSGTEGRRGTGRPVGDESRRHGDNRGDSASTSAQPRAHPSAGNATRIGSGSSSASKPPPPPPSSRRDQNPPKSSTGMNTPKQLSASSASKADGKTTAAPVYKPVKGDEATITWDASQWPARLAALDTNPKSLYPTLQTKGVQHIMAALENANIRSCLDGAASTYHRGCGAFHHEARVFVPRCGTAPPDHPFWRTEYLTDEERKAYTADLTDRQGALNREYGQEDGSMVRCYCTKADKTERKVHFEDVLGVLRRMKGLDLVVDFKNQTIHVILTPPTSDGRKAAVTVALGTQGEWTDHVERVALRGTDGGSGSLAMCWMRKAHVALDNLNYERVWAEEGSAKRRIFRKHERWVKENCGEALKLAGEREREEMVWTGRILRGSMQRALQLTQLNKSVEDLNKRIEENHADVRKWTRKADQKLREEIEDSTRRTEEAMRREAARRVEEEKKFLEEANKDIRKIMASHEAERASFQKRVQELEAEVTRARSDRGGSSKGGHGAGGSTASAHHQWPPAEHWENLDRMHRIRAAEANATWWNTLSSTASYYVRMVV